MHEEADTKIEGILRKISPHKIESCYVLTEFARLDCVITLLVIRFTSVTGPWNTAPQR